MAVRSNVVSVSTTATALVTGADIDYNRQYRDLGLKNTGSTPVYLGGSDVTSTTGFLLAVGEGMTLNQVIETSWPYAITASGTGSVSVIQFGV